MDFKELKIMLATHRILVICEYCSNFRYNFIMIFKNISVVICCVFMSLRDNGLTILNTNWIIVSISSFH